MPGLEPNKQHQKPKLIGTCYLVGEQNISNNNNNNIYPIPMTDPYVWNIYLLIGIILQITLGVNVGKYSIHGSYGIGTCW